MIRMRFGKEIADGDEEDYGHGEPDGAYERANDLPYRC